MTPFIFVISYPQYEESYCTHFQGQAVHDLVDPKDDSNRILHIVSKHSPLYTASRSIRSESSAKQLCEAQMSKKDYFPKIKMTNTTLFTDRTFLSKLSYKTYHTISSRIIMNINWTFPHFKNLFTEKTPVVMKWVSYMKFKISSFD
jgi:hypothetical protein